MSATPAPRILIVEDDENLRVGLEDNLEEAGFWVGTASDAATARERLAAAAESGERFDLIVLDVMLPDANGYQLCEELRSNGERAMVLMLTARTLEEDIVRGFDAGADDYLAKPYRVAELLARARALLRRTEKLPPADVHTLGSYQVDVVARVVKRGSGARVALTRTEFDLLVHFMNNAGRALHRQSILDAVWGEDVIVDDRTVDNFVSSLKKKLSWSASDPWRITTIRGVGYRFETETHPDTH